MFPCVRGWMALLCLGLCCGSPKVGGADDTRLVLLGKLIRDDSPKVRLEVLRALAKIPSAESAELALSVLERPMDATLDYGLWLTINELAEPWIAALEAGRWRPEGREDQLAFALRALKPEQAGRVLNSVLGDKPLPGDGSGPWIEAIGVAGGPGQVGRLLTQAVTNGFDDAAILRAFKAAAEAARVRQVFAATDPAVLDGALIHPHSNVRLEAIRLAGLWKQERHVAVLLRSISGGVYRRADERAAAFGALRQVGSSAVKLGLADLAGSGSEAEVRQGAAVALAALDGLKGFPAVVAGAGTLGTEAAALDYWRGVLSIKGASAPLREALAGKAIPELAAWAGMRVAREGGRDDVELLAAFAKAGGVSTDWQELTAGLIREVAARASERGEPHRGERVFRRPDLACVTCHSIGGAGGRVGPDLTSIGASAPMDYLAESLLLPSAKIKEGYHAVVVETRDGGEIAGTLARETPEELFLRNVSGQEVGVAKTTISRRETARLSLMPSGLVDALGEQDRLDLLAFLGRLGKAGEFDASQGGVARRWRVGNVVHTDQQNNDTEWYWSRSFDDARWVSAYALVNGGLTRDMLEEVTKAQAWSSKITVVAATEVEQSTAGSVEFRCSVPEAEVWLGGKRLGAGPKIRAEVPAGRHRVVVKLDPRRLPDVLRLEGTGMAFVPN